MIQRIAKRIGEQQEKNPKQFILAFIILILITIPGIPFLIGNVEASLEQVLPEHVESVETMNHARTHYSADMVHIVLYAQGAITDIRQAQDFAYEIQQRLEGKPKITHVEATLDTTRTNDAKTIGVIDIQANTGTDTANIQEVLHTIQEAITYAEHTNPGVHTQITGFAAIDQATFSTIMSDFLRITAIAMTLILTILYALFRTIRNTLVPMAVVMVALIATMGITGYLGITITVVTMVAAAMILGLGIDFGIHTIHSYSEYRKKKTPPEAMKYTVEELFRAQLAASLTTSAGFLALGLGVLPAMANLGIVLAIGILLTFLASTLLLPPLLLLTEKTTT